MLDVQQMDMSDCFFFGLFQGDAWICMELMTTSFDQCYRHIYGVLHQTIPEDILGMTSLTVSIQTWYPVL